MLFEIQVLKKKKNPFHGLERKLRCFWDHSALGDFVRLGPRGRCFLNHSEVTEVHSEPLLSPGHWGLLQHWQRGVRSHARGGETAAPEAALLLWPKEERADAAERIPVTRQQPGTRRPHFELLVGPQGDGCASSVPGVLLSQDPKGIFMASTPAPSSRSAS